MPEEQEGRMVVDETEDKPEFSMIEGKTKDGTEMRRYHDAESTPQDSVVLYTLGYEVTFVMASESAAIDLFDAMKLVESIEAD